MPDLEIITPRPEPQQEAPTREIQSLFLSENITSTSASDFAFCKPATTLPTHQASSSYQTSHSSIISYMAQTNGQAIPHVRTNGAPDMATAMETCKRWCEPLLGYRSLMHVTLVSRVLDTQKLLRSPRALSPHIYSRSDTTQPPAKSPARPPTRTRGRTPARSSIRPPVKLPPFPIAATSEVPRLVQPVGSGLPPKPPYVAAISSGRRPKWLRYPRLDTQPWTRESTEPFQRPNQVDGPADALTKVAETVLWKLQCFNGVRAATSNPRIHPGRLDGGKTLAQSALLPKLRCDSGNPGSHPDIVSQTSLLGGETFAHLVRESQCEFSPDEVHQATKKYQTPPSECTVNLTLSNSTLPADRRSSSPLRLLTEPNLKTLKANSEEYRWSTGKLFSVQWWIDQTNHSFGLLRKLADEKLSHDISVWESGILDRLRHASCYPVNPKKLLSTTLDWQENSLIRNRKALLRILWPAYDRSSNCMNWISASLHDSLGRQEMDERIRSCIQQLNDRDDDYGVDLQRPFWRTSIDQAEFRMYGLSNNQTATVGVPVQAPGAREYVSKSNPNYTENSRRLPNTDVSMLLPNTVPMALPHIFTGLPQNIRILIYSFLFTPKISEDFTSEQNRPAQKTQQCGPSSQVASPETPVDFLKLTAAEKRAYISSPHLNRIASGSTVLPDPLSSENFSNPGAHLVFDQPLTLNAFIQLCQTTDIPHWRSHRLNLILWNAGDFLVTPDEVLGLQMDLVHLTSVPVPKLDTNVAWLPHLQAALARYDVLQCAIQTICKRWENALRRLPRSVRKIYVAAPLPPCSVSFRREFEVCMERMFAYANSRSLSPLEWRAEVSWNGQVFHYSMSQGRYELSQSRFTWRGA